MKTLHRFIVRSYILPCIMTFVICMFILLMQFLWRYIDDLVGKGLELHILFELMFYTSASLVPLALPLSILLSSIMTFGNLAENYELVAMKSAGLSLRKIMMPLVITTMGISVLAFYFSNFILPLANLKMGSLLYDVREQKPALQIKEGIFYNGIDGYSIRVGKKDKDGKTLYDVMIYDHSEGMGNSKVVIAKSGRMDFSADKNYLVVTLFNGSTYNDMVRNRQDQTYPFIRNSFKEQVMRFELVGFKLSRSDEQLFKDDYRMLNMWQLESNIDSLHVFGEKRKENVIPEISRIYLPKSMAYISAVVPDKKVVVGADILQGLDKSSKLRVIETATNIARSSKTYVEMVVNELKENKRAVWRNSIEWHKKLTLPFSCLVMFFIGAPLGAIIRKGGLGMPVVVSIVFFVIFYVITMSGERMAKEGALSPLVGVWLATVSILPIGVFLTYKASTDSTLFDVTALLNSIRKFFLRFSKKREAA